MLIKILFLIVCLIELWNKTNSIYIYISVWSLMIKTWTIQLFVSVLHVMLQVWDQYLLNLKLSTSVNDKHCSSYIPDISLSASLLLLFCREETTCSHLSGRNANLFLCIYIICGLVARDIYLSFWIVVQVCVTFVCKRCLWLHKYGSFTCLVSVL